MKTRIFILICMITTFGVILPNTASLTANDVVPSAELPSTQYINSEGYIFSRGSATTRENSISLYAENINSENPWGEISPPTGGGSWGGNVGGPIGDVTPIILVLLILVYSIYRSVSISKRKNL